MRNPIQQTVLELILEKSFPINQTIIMRLNNYTYQDNTIILQTDNEIILSTEYKIRGVHHLLIIHSDGTSKWDFQFDND